MGEKEEENDKLEKENDELKEKMRQLIENLKKAPEKVVYTMDRVDKKAEDAPKPEDKPKPEEKYDRIFGEVEDLKSPPTEEELRKKFEEDQAEAKRKDEEDLGKMKEALEKMNAKRDDAH